MANVIQSAPFDVPATSRTGELHEQLLALDTGTSVSDVLLMARRCDPVPASIDEIEVLGTVLGWQIDALFDHVMQTGNSAYWTSVICELPGFSDYVGRNADKWRACLSKPSADQQGIWHLISDVEPEILELVAEAMCIAATRTPDGVAADARARLPKLPASVAVEHLQAIAGSGRAPQRAKAIDALADLAEGADRKRLVDWVDSHLADDQSTGVRHAIARLKAMPTVEIPKPPLPAVDLPEIAGFDAAADEAMAGVNECDTQLMDLHALLTTVNGSELRQVGWYALATLAHLADTSRTSVSELNRFHLARVLLANRQADYRSLPSLTALADRMPSPLELRAVAEVDSGTELGLIEVVAAVHAARPELWSSKAITDFVAFHDVACAKLLGSWDGSYSFDRVSFVGLIEAAETLPEKVKEATVQATVGRRRSDTEALLRIVDAGWSDRVLRFFVDGSPTRRVGAARWIVHHRPAGAVGQLREALDQEGNPKAKAAMLDALEALGESLDEFADLERLLAEASMAMAKKNAKPKAISWLDFDVLPSLAWSDGSSVPPELIQWFVASSVKADRVDPSPILRRHTDNLETETAHRFGSTLLDVWLAEDDRQSIAECRGLLGVVAATAGPDVAAPAMTYIRKYRGRRKSQTTALIRMMAWVDEPATTQAVMSIADYFPTRSLQLEARNQAELLAARRGLTVEELADRAVPDGGFGSDGHKTLNFGQRSFTAHLEDDLTIRLVNDSTGKTIRSLPAARSTECAAHVKKLKSDLTALKKELKRTQAIQPDRLRASMIAGRTWSVDDFQAYFLDQPVMRRLAARVVWRSSGDNGGVTFRPVSDGSLVGLDDIDVELDLKAQVSLAHEQLVDDVVSSQWQIHLADYEITPLFGQFARPPVSIAESQTLIEDFIGFGHTDATVRTIMQRLNWKMGSTEETGLVGEFVKDVPGTNLTAVIGIFGGLHPGVVDSLGCFLHEMYFVPSGERPENRANAVELSTVPSVVLTELYADGEAIASAGSGFEPNDKQKICG